MTIPPDALNPVDLFPMQFRNAVSADHSALMQLVQVCVAGMRAAGIEQWDEVYPGSEDISRDIAGGTAHLMCDGEMLVGSVTVDQVLDPLWVGLDWTSGSEPAAAVHRLMVHPDRQGQGLARRLMEHAEIVAREQGCRCIRLDTFLNNPIAMALYPRLGYRQTGKAMLRKGEFAGFEKLL